MLRLARCALATSLIATVALAPGRDARATQDAEAPDKRVAAALEFWRSNDPSARLRALKKLEQLGGGAAPAVPALIAGLSDRDAEVRREIAEVLYRIGAPAHLAVPALLANLNDPDKGVRAAAAWALSVAKPDPKLAMPALIANLRAGPERRCLVAVNALAALGEPAVPPLIELLNVKDEPLRARAASALGEIGPPARGAIPALIELLRLPDRETRENVATALAGIGPEAVEPLTQALRDRDPKVRGGAAFALEKLGAQAKPAIPALVAALSDPDPPDDPRPPRTPGFEDFRRDGAPQALGFHAALRAIGAPALPALLQQLDAPERRARVVALKAIEFLWDDAQPAVPRLIALLGDPDVRGEAASALGGLGAREAIPPLLAALNDPDPHFRARAAENLGRIGWERQFGQYSSRTLARGAIKPLAAALKDSDAGVRAAAARALDDIGTEAAAVIPDLAAALSDPAPDVQLAAIRAFRRIGKIPAESRGLLVAWLKHPDPRLRRAAANAIHAKGLNDGSTIPALVAALKDKDADARAAAAMALLRARRAESSGDGGLDNDGPDLVDDPLAPAAMREALADSDARVRAAAAELLPLFRRDGATSVRLLTARLKDPDASVRRAAARSLARFPAAAKDTTPALLEALNNAVDGVNDSSSVAVIAARTLAAIGPTSKKAMIDQSTARLVDPDKSARARAADALRSLRHDVGRSLFRLLADPNTPRPLKREILNVVADNDGISMPHTADAEGRPSQEVLDAIPAVQEFARDEDEHVRAQARSILVAAARGGEAIARATLEAVRAGDMKEVKHDWALIGLERDAIVVLIEGLQDDSAEVRTEAAYGLAVLADSLPRLEDDDDGAKPDPAAAAWRVRGLQLRSRAGDALVAALNDRDTQVRWAAAEGLLAIRDGRGAVPALLEMASDRTTRVRLGARIRRARAFIRYDRAAEGNMLRIAAIHALGRFGAAAAPAVPVLLEALKDGDDLTRWYAAQSLGEIGPAAKSAVPALTGLLRSKFGIPLTPGAPRLVAKGPDRFAVAAAQSLGQIGPDASPAVDALIEALADPDEALRAEAAQALGRIGAEAAASIPLLVRALLDHGSSVDQIASTALGQIGAAAVAPLIEALKIQDAEVRQLAIDALGEVGPGAAAAIPDLVKSSIDPDEETRVVAAKALGKIGNGPAADACVPALIKALKDPDRLVRASAAEALGEIGARHDRVVPALVAAFHDSDEEVNGNAAVALAMIGDPAMPAIWPLVRDNDKILRNRAASVLGWIANAEWRQRNGERYEHAFARTKRAREALFVALKDQDARIRETASQVLDCIAKDIVPDLIAALRDPSPLVRMHAARILESAGEKSAAALASLQILLKDTDDEVRRAAQDTIDAIGKHQP
jgi:HEAT repeat protein